MEVRAWGLEKAKKGPESESAKLRSLESERPERPAPASKRVETPMQRFQ
jgi:hypothetical protein